jgi:hypothetical protein
MKILGQARLFAIHYQFLVFDSARLVDVEKLAQWNEERSRRGYIATEHCCFIGTTGHTNDHILEVYMAEGLPEDYTAERIILLPLTVQSRGVTIGDILNFEEEPAMTVNIEPGDYGIYCLAYNLGTEPTDEEFELSDDEFCQLAHIEKYRLVFVKGKVSEARVIQGSEFRY